MCCTHLFRETHTISSQRRYICGTDGYGKSTLAGSRWDSNDLILRSFDKDL